MHRQPISPELLKILACPVCKSDVLCQDDSLVCTKNGCGLRFPVVDGIPVMMTEGTEQHVSQAKYFDTEFETYSKYELENWRVSYLHRIFSALNVGDSQDGLYLDIGVGGSGYTVIEAARRGCRCVGMDLSLQGIRKARHFADLELGDGSPLCSFVVCLAENLPFKSGAFSMASSIAVLEHIPDDKRAVAEFARVTSPSGRIFITVPNAYRRIPPIFWLPYIIWDKRIGHLRHYKCEDLVSELSMHGFVAPQVMYSGHLIKVMQSLLCMVFSRLNRRESALWWRLERKDLDGSKEPSGLQVSVTMQKRKGVAGD